MSDNAQNQPLLLATDLKKTFIDSGVVIEVLRGTSLRVETGQTLSITGQSGCGKSTLLNVISGLESMDSGEVLWNGRSLNDYRGSRVARLRGQFFGFIFQSYHLVTELNAIENVLLAARLVGSVKRSTRGRARDLLASVGLADRINHSVLKLSGGERQRVAIARALMNEPGVVLADEPTGNLDESTAQEVMDLLFKVCRDHQSALLLVTHNPGFAQLTQQQLVLHDGKLAQYSD